ncbi:FAD-binding oxidoreductase [Lachnospiraceae bacterium YH-ros2228]
MKVNGFLKDVTGANRVIKARRQLIQSGSPENLYKDHIREVAEEVHPNKTHVRITKVEEVSPTARKFTFVPEDGDTLPPFYAGQYCSIDLKVKDEESGKTTVTTRPYSISSAPYQARQGEKSFFELTIRNGRPGQGFISSYLYEKAHVGDHFTVHLPFGQFHYEPLRDAKHILALAGGSGITPFYSMAQEIAHGSLDCDLTILYGSRDRKDIILVDELSKIEAECDRVRFINVLSDDPDYDGEKGFLSRDLIEKYSYGKPSDGETSYFVCGPLPMYNFVSGELKALNVPAKRIRMEVFGAPRDITKASGYRIRKANKDLPVNSEIAPYPEDQAETIYHLTVLRGLEKTVIDALSTEPLAVSLERAGIPNQTRCRSGACGYCRSKLIEGEVFVPDAGDGRRYADKKFGYIHACSTFPLGDCTIQIIIS